MPEHRRGGRRPGAGAPIGNLNALKHGRRSAQLKQLFAAATRSRRVRLALAGIISAAMLYRAGLVAARRRKVRAPAPQAGHQTGEIAP